MTTTPPSLLQQLRSAPDARSWGDFIELYTPLLYRWANRTGVRDQDAVDLVQEVFVVLVEKLPTFHYDPNRSFRAWLKTVLLNLQRNHLRRNFRAEAALAEVARKEEVPPAEDLGEREYREHLTRRAMELMRSDFAEPTWRACWLIVVENRTVAEVASELSLSENAVYIAKCRVLARLRHKLQGLID